MEAEVIQELQLIRNYLFIMMCGICLVILFKLIESIQKIIIGFRDAVVKSFNDRMEKLLEKGKNDEIIKECKEILEKRPNDTDAIWYLSRAYYREGENELAKEQFERSVYLVPSWESSAKPFLDNLNK